MSKVRLLVFDTNTKKQILQDEEIQFFLDENPNIYRAAAGACESIAASLGREIDRSVIGANDSPTRSADFYTELAKRYRARANSNAKIFAGGRTVSGKETLAEDDDAIQPSFAVGQDDVPVRQDANMGRFFVSETK